MSLGTLEIPPLFPSTSKKRKPIDKNIRNIVWQKHNKNSLLGKCYCCRRPVTHDNFQIGHNKAVAKGGRNNVSNLRVICGPCNRGMRTTSIESYKKKYFGGKKIKISKKKISKKKSVKRKGPFDIELPSLRF